LPAFGKAAPAFGKAAPAFGKATPAFGKAAPAFGKAAPAFGKAAPACSTAVKTPVDTIALPQLVGTVDTSLFTSYNGTSRSDCHISVGKEGERAFHNMKGGRDVSNRLIKSDAFWLAFERFALILSFIMNVGLIVLVLVLLGLLLPIRDLIARPTMDKLMAEINRLGTMHIKDEIPVENQMIRVKFDLPLSQEVNVTTTAPVPLTTQASFTLPGGGGYILGTVNIELPTNTVLPVMLDTTVPVDQMVPISMIVPVDIDLGKTDLKTVADNLKALLEPIDDLLGE
jgi:hypothetical protein